MLACASFCLARLSYDARSGRATAKDARVSRMAAREAGPTDGWAALQQIDQYSDGATPCRALLRQIDYEDDSSFDQQWKQLDCNNKMNMIQESAAHVQYLVSSKQEQLDPERANSAASAYLASGRSLDASASSGTQELGQGKPVDRAAQCRTLLQQMDLGFPPHPKEPPFEEQWSQLDCDTRMNMLDVSASNMQYLVPFQLLAVEPETPPTAAAAHDRLPAARTSQLSSRLGARPSGAVPTGKVAGHEPLATYLARRNETPRGAVTRALQLQALAAHRAGSFDQTADAESRASTKQPIGGVEPGKPSSRLAISSLTQRRRSPLPVSVTVRVP